MTPDDGRATRIEADIKEINKNIAKLFRMLSEVTSGDATWRETMCDQHSRKLEALDVETKRIGRSADSRWPTIIAAGAGSFVSTLTVALTILLIAEKLKP